MKFAVYLVFLTLFSAATANAGQTHGSVTSKYAGEEKRNIKSLSGDDLDELRRGGGWGLAKAAELNGIPGPAHLLELKDDIALSKDQMIEITKIYKEMRAQAIEQGVRLISLEQDLETLFRNGSANQATLRSALKKIAETRMELRYIHLATHLETPKILSKDQITKYNELRGYSDPNPCSKIPLGHNAAIWRKHNGCNELDTK